MTDASIDPGLFRQALAGFPSGVTVVTTLGDDGRMVGFTASAFSSLSLDPPLVLVCPALTSSTYPHLVRRQRFAIHILAAGQQAIAMAFASKGTDKVAALDWRESELGNPILPGAACVIECTLWRDYEGGDHAIVVGAVQRIDHADRSVLLYHRGAMADHPPIAEAA
ncbi:flavin reductase family protein [Sphingomonas carotinifaciens]|uniref:Flavin reductase n=1 Tax=Sphingomonas carotinifaciens TaxID=1166323 RepID=A0A1G7MPG0_9SPHN|nr:flavin reductase family protein [Sphingomonas carotinifaciens]MBB4086755.1 flavin reductase (DIM6/NTAB) family NADH-FMN oxidoreductase RutF [Sphingomonas carotinifaciens]MWC42224.1 flavin reductase [Sphingomonas carotinifaciens]SDF63010.1 NADH-FMN oxidoreductase RutF, flavin reductase (DIM6/NTAB) family [Sphingomonas carotinifaciens]